MSEERTRILSLLAEGRITVEEAERLLEAVGGAGSRTTAESAPAAGPLPRFLRVVVSGDEKAQVNIRIPVQLLRSGINLSAMLDGEAGAKVGAALQKKGIPLDISRLKSGEIDALIQSLSDLEVDVKDGQQKIRVYCE